jgi:hypothetical protein
MTDKPTPETLKEAQEDELIANIERILQRQLDGQEPLRLSQQRRLIGLFDTEPLRQLCRDLVAASCKAGAAIQSLDLESDYYIEGTRHPHLKAELLSCLEKIDEVLAAARKAGVTE